MWPAILPQLAQRDVFFQLRGRHRLAELADTSHAFLRGHSHWAAVKRALRPDAAGSLEQRIRETATVANAPLVMAALAWRTLELCGDSFLKTPVAPTSDIVLARATGYSPSLMDRLKGRSSCERVIFNERRQDAWFAILPAQEITSAAELDKRNYHDGDARCYEGMGPIPVDCRAGSCGTCWVGILGGNENLDPADDFERKRMKYFGYWDSGFIDESVERPLIRLACQVRANGSVSIAIPLWNGVFGESRRERESG